MIVHVNVLELVTPGSFTLVTCNCTLRYKQKTDIKPKLLTFFKYKRFKESKHCVPVALSFFFQVSFKLGSSQGYTRPTFNCSFFLDLVQQVEKLILYAETIFFSLVRRSCHWH